MARANQGLSSNTRLGYYCRPHPTSVGSRVTLVGLLGLGDRVEQGWPTSGRDGTEIDIMEKPWLDDRIQLCRWQHRDGYGEDHKSKGMVVKDCLESVEGFHTVVKTSMKSEGQRRISGRLASGEAKAIAEESMKMT